MFTIHVYVNTIYIPVVFCLLRNKSAHTYEKMFQLINEKCQEMGSNMCGPETIVVDFEKSIHVGIKNVFQSAKIIGCRFHLAQSW